MLTLTVTRDFDPDDAVRRCHRVEVKAGKRRVAGACVGDVPCADCGRPCRRTFAGSVSGSLLRTESDVCREAAAALLGAVVEDAERDGVALRLLVGEGDPWTQEEARRLGFRAVASRRSWGETTVVFEKEGVPHVG